MTVGNLTAYLYDAVQMFQVQMHYGGINSRVKVVIHKLENFQPD